MAKLAFVDTETTGLDPDRHHIWEVGLILRDTDTDEPDTEYVWQFEVDLSTADAKALEVGRFHDRYATDADGYVVEWLRRDWAETFARLTWGAHLVGAVVSFDEERLRRLLRGSGQCPGWYYHLVDVEALAAGVLRVQPPWSSRELWRLMNVSVPEDERHTALGDARVVRDVYDAVMRIPRHGAAESFESAQRVLANATAAGSLLPVRCEGCGVTAGGFAELACQCS